MDILNCELCLHAVPASSAITVQVAQFSDYVQEMKQEDQGGNKFVKEFEVSHCTSIHTYLYILMELSLHFLPQDLDNIPQAVCNVARLPHNKPHNRFKNIYPCKDAYCWLN